MSLPRASVMRSPSSVLEPTVPKLPRSTKTLTSGKPLRRAATRRRGGAGAPLRGGAAGAGDRPAEAPSGDGPPREQADVVDSALDPVERLARLDVDRGVGRRG